MLRNPDLRHKIPRLRADEIYGQYKDIVSRANITKIERRSVDLRNISDESIVAIQVFLDIQGR
jgi:hypothetical protein